MGDHPILVSKTPSICASRISETSRAVINDVSTTFGSCQPTMASLTSSNSVELILYAHFYNNTEKIARRAWLAGAFPTQPEVEKHNPLLRQKDTMKKADFLQSITVRYSS